MFLTSSFSNSCSGVTTGATSEPSEPPSEPSSSLDTLVVSTITGGAGASSPSISPSSATPASFFLASFFFDFVFGDPPAASSSRLVVVSLVGGRFARFTFLVVVVAFSFSFSFSFFLFLRVTSRSACSSPFDAVPVSVVVLAPSSSSLSRFFLLFVDPILNTEGEPGVE